MSDSAQPLSRQHRILLGLVLAFQLVLSVQAVLEMHAGPFGAAPVLDEESYVNWGRRIAAGDWLGSRVFGQEPLYPYTLGITFALTGGSLLAVRFLQVAAGLLTTLLVFLLARRISTPAAGIAAALVLALFGPLYLHVAELEKATLTLCGSALFLYLVARSRETGRLATWLCAGLAYGALMLLRGNFVPLLLPLLVWVALRTGVKTPSLKAAAAVLAGVVVVLSPVAVRNRVVGGEWVLTTASGGLNFFIGNGPGASGTNRPLEFVRATPDHEIADFEAEASRRAGRQLTPSESSRFWLAEGLRALAADPLRAVKLWATKALLAVNAYEVPDNYSFDCARSELMPTLWLGFLDFGVLVSLALLGALLARDRTKRWLPLFALAFAATLVVFFVLGRYRVPLLPALAALGGIGVVELASRWRKRELKDARWGLAALLVGLALTHVSLPQASWSPAQQAHCHDLIGTTWTEQGRLDEAEHHLTQAASLAPGDAGVRYNLGVALQLAGRLSDAEREYRAAIERRPSHDQAHLNLALLLIQRGETQQARQHLEVASRGFVAEKAKEILRQLDAAPPR